MRAATFRGRRLLAACGWLAALLAAPSLAATPPPDAVALPSAEVGGPLVQFLSGLQTLQLRFSQEITNSRGVVVERGEGTLSVQRPGRFRWDYQPRGIPVVPGQLLLADGRNLWFFDRELEQVTVRAQAEALGATPMLLLTEEVATWRDGFSIEPATTRAGISWQVVRPRAAGADFSRAELAFRRLHLVSMIIYDQLGQRATMTFSDGKRNGMFGSNEFRFELPPGVALLGKPLP